MFARNTEWIGDPGVKLGCGRDDDDDDDDDDDTFIKMHQNFNINTFI